ncbi:MAG: sigma factor, partial [Acidobacteriota bacterium]
MATTTAHESFDQHRDYLTGVAYRMLGSLSEAEDMVQESFLRWHRIDPSEIQSPRAWLT